MSKEEPKAWLGHKMWLCGLCKMFLLGVRKKQSQAAGRHQWTLASSGLNGTWSPALQAIPPGPAGPRSKGTSGSPTCHGWTQPHEALSGEGGGSERLLSKGLPEHLWRVWQNSLCPGAHGTFQSLPVGGIFV